jgi:hypothetical protein
MHATRKKLTADLKLIDNLIVSPDTSTVNGELLTDFTESVRFWTEAATDCVLSVTTK